ncbi:regulator of microtubule dynamics protein 2 isoform X3 [Brachyhypopomus gauderio]|uniref:regulator of microtubule dynamics protein 2 isoform X3 n=1 Tax=Brachyhypopomus gauderio TaxID=698409 RepID=UPI00404206C1
MKVRVGYSFRSQNASSSHSCVCVHYCPLPRSIASKAHYLSACIRRMAQGDSKVLALGVLAGAAGIGLAAVWYQSRRAVSTGEGPGAWRPASYGSSGAGQTEVLQQLASLIQCVSELKEEVRALKDALPHLQDHVRDELRERAGARKASPYNRTTPTRRKRAGGVARAEGQSSEEGESEGGYMTALTDSEEEGQRDEDQQAQEQLDELTVLLRKADGLHECNGAQKMEGLSTLLEKKEEFDQKCQYLWRLTRAYADAHDMTADSQEKKKYAENGKQIGALAISVNPLCAESHQWPVTQSTEVLLGAGKSPLCLISHWVSHALCVSHHTLPISLPRTLPLHAIQ